jgi:hypothetical protein
MALQLGAVRDAFLAANVPEAKAAAAAEELAAYNAEFSGLRSEIREGFARVDQEFAKVRGEMREGFARVDQEFAKVRGEMREGFAGVDQKFARVDQEFAKVRGEINLLRWMCGTNLVLTAGVLFRLLTH